MKPKFYEWLKRQPKEFVENFNNNEMLGNGHFEINDLAELDDKYNPEGEQDGKPRS